MFTYITRREYLYFAISIILIFIVSEILIFTGVPTILFYLVLAYFVVVNIYILYIKTRKLDILHPKYSISEYPKISVIVPSHEGDNKRRVYQVVKRVLYEQTYPKDKIEVLFMWTGKRLVNIKDARIRYYKVKDRIEAMNKGIELAQGDIIGFVDSNTLICTDALRYVAGYFEKYKDICCVQGVRIIDRNGNKGCVAQISYSNWMYIFEDKLKKTSFNGFVNFSGSNGWWKKEIISKYKFRGIQHTQTEDIDASIRVITNENNRIIITPLVYSHDLPPRNFRGLIRQRIRWSQGWLESFVINIKNILRNNYYCKKDLTFLLFLTLVSPVANILCWSILLSWLFLYVTGFSGINFLGTFLLFVNFIVGGTMFAYGTPKERLIYFIVSPLYHFLFSLFALSGTIKLLLKDRTWFKSIK